MSTQTEASGQPGSSHEEEIAKAQVEWLKSLLIQIGPRKVLCGYEYMRLAVFIEAGLERIKSQVIFKHMSDDDIPF